LQEIYSVEAKSISAFMEVVVKLSEATFRPLFVRVYDWAAVELVDEASRTSHTHHPRRVWSRANLLVLRCGSPAETEAHLIARRTILFAVMEGLLERFKSIMTPYTAIVLDHAQELLQSYVDGTITDIGLWSQIMLTFDKSFEYDEGGVYLFFISVPLFQVASG
jgi:U3 small nucleolar RNA-associated protein 10